MVRNSINQTTPGPSKWYIFRCIYSKHKNVFILYTAAKFRSSLNFNVSVKVQLLQCAKHAIFIRKLKPYSRFSINDVTYKLINHNHAL